MRFYTDTFTILSQNYSNNIPYSYSKCSHKIKKQDIDTTTSLDGRLVSYNLMQIIGNKPNMLLIILSCLYSHEGK